MREEGFVDMKRTRIYVALGIAFLLNSSLFFSNGWAIETEVFSFVIRKDRGHSIQLINTQGEFLQRLMLEGSIAHFTWSPDGHSMAYSSNRNGDPDIYIMDVRTNTHRQLTFFHDSRDLWPAWSPNGKWIAFISERTGDRHIYRMDVTGENVKRLTNQGGCNKPAWSPDSQWIAFGSTLGKGVEIDNFLSLMTAEGRGVRRIADTSQPDCAWSSNGKEIAFVPPTDVVGGVALFSVDKEGKNRRQLTELYKGPVLILNPIWSPRGKRIAYVLIQIPIEFLARKRVPAEELFADSVICIANTADGEGGKPIEATRKLVYGSTVEWVPEGFLSVSPSEEKQTTLWGKLKQSEKERQLNVIH